MRVIFKEAASTPARALFANGLEDLTGRQIPLSLVTVAHVIARRGAMQAKEPG